MRENRAAVVQQCLQTHSAALTPSICTSYGTLEQSTAFDVLVEVLEVSVHLMQRI